MENRVFGGRYQLTERIGMGGMAEVYKAIDTTLGRTVAVKVMLPQYAKDATFAARFRQEAQAAANLASPYIVNIYDWGRDGDSYYIVMEYVRGTELKTAIGERGAIHQRKVAEIGAQVCSALSVAHSYDIIHRDIKSANIMIQTDGNVKVMDFGIAQAGNTSMTTTSSVLGTAHYVSPEQAQGKPLTPASDLYSLGVVLYEAVTGQLPFDGPDAVSVALKQVNEAPAPVHTINPTVDRSLEAIINRAMAKRVADRYQTAAEMRRDLEAYLAGARTSAGATAATVATGAAVGATTVMQPLDNQVENANTYNASTNRKKGGKKKVIIAIVIVLILAAAGFGVAVYSGACAAKVATPNVVGVQLENAKTTILTSGFKVGTITYETSTTVTKDTIIKQSPTGGELARTGSKIDLVVSSGESTELVQVPDLKGLSDGDAKAMLSSAGLLASSSEEYSESDSQKGLVFRQSPSSGEKIAKGSTVTYVISLGKKSEEVEVPYVVGSSKEAAISTLKSAGFSVDSSTEASEQPANTVISQNPSSGTLTKGETVSIVVSSGPEQDE